MTSREFRINLCTTDQIILSSISDGYSGRYYDKISALKELGFEFCPANKINVLMVKGALLNVECKLSQEITFGDQIMLIGEVVEANHNPEKQSLIYQDGKYWTLNPLAKLEQEKRQKIRIVMDKYRKSIS
jgi:flavin reductase (DIM6/NTAB) family NADH-FMN oxidoreductase RutF